MRGAAERNPESVEPQAKQMLAQELKLRREMLGYTQQGFAERLGLARRTVQYYESGEHPIPRTVELALQALELEQK